MRGEYLWVLALVGVLMLGKRKYMEARGLRNNNPGNIRHYPGNQWVGQVGVDPDGFVIFDTPENGIRAMGLILDSYRRAGVLGVEDIITRWAPHGENDTGSYLQHVRMETGWGAEFQPARTNYADLVAVMIEHENGVNPFNREFIQGALTA